MRVCIPSVGYADMLSITVPAWRRLVPAGTRIIVVTDQADRETQAVCRAARVGIVVTGAWRRDGAVFNKAAALDEAFGFTSDLAAPPDVGEACLAADADIYPVGALPSLEALETGVLYGAARRLCQSPAQLEDCLAGRIPFQALRERNRADRGAGYFQLFRYRPGLSFGSFPDAGHYDLAFHAQFARVEGVTSCAMLHMGRTSSRNWRGRILPRWGAA